ncbi:hypothetical protein ACFQX6_47305 [Streptosporangium lutulentum]
MHVVAGARGATAELTALAEAGQVEVVEVDLSVPTGPARLVEVAVERGSSTSWSTTWAPSRRG